MSIRVSVDRGLCRGHGQCELVAPEVFEIDDENIAVVLEDSFDDRLEPSVEDAKLRCPEAAIFIERLSNSDDS